MALKSRGPGNVLRTAISFFQIKNAILLSVLILIMDLGIEQRDSLPYAAVFVKANRQRR
jgi:hypothetical protein